MLISRLLIALGSIIALAWLISPASKFQSSRAEPATSAVAATVNGRSITVREVELAATYDVSRGTLRETLRSLQEDGLVEVIPFRGAFVSSLSAKRARESARSSSEPEAVGRSTARRSGRNV